MGLKSKLPYHRRLLLLLLVSSWVLVACFIVFQYGREKHFKAEQLNSQLQLFNIQFLDALAGGANIDSLARQHKKPFEEQRITVIDLSGKVLFDSSSDTTSMTNHLDRPEVIQALENGTGYVIRRHSESTHLNYFYSATKNDSLIVRSAVPYSVSLREVLAASTTSTRPRKTTP